MRCSQRPTMLVEEPPWSQGARFTRNSSEKGKKAAKILRFRPISRTVRQLMLIQIEATDRE